MFQDYMRSRLGLGGNGAQSTSVPQGFNPMPFHPQVNPMGWPGHPMNPNGVSIPTETPISQQPIVGGPGTVSPTSFGPPSDNSPKPMPGPIPGNRFNPYNY